MKLKINCIMILSAINGCDSDTGTILIAIYIGLGFHHGYLGFIIMAFVLFEA